MPDLEAMIAWEQGELDDDGITELFQDLIDTDLAWQLHGVYGRTARDLISAGLVIPNVSRPCNRDGCSGTYRASGTPHFDANGSAMVDLTCDNHCGMESVAYWTWNGDIS